MARPVRVVALDLEGTLISNAISCFPRPGLYAFLEFCRETFSRVVLFTSVSEHKAREIVRLLAEEGSAPEWFAEIEYVPWPSGERTTKDLSWVGDAAPEEVLLVDDQEYYVHPGQEAQWVPVKEFQSPFTQKDPELERMAALLRERK